MKKDCPNSPGSSWTLMMIFQLMMMQDYIPSDPSDTDQSFEELREIVNMNKENRRKRSNKSNSDHSKKQKMMSKKIDNRMVMSCQRKHFTSFPVTR